MKFKEIYPNATMLDDDFLKDEFSYSLSQITPKDKQSLYRQYYLHMCAAVSELHYMHPSPSQIEQLLIAPNVPITSNKVNVSFLDCARPDIYTNITDANERKYLFLTAQYHQLAFDVGAGRTAMLRGEDKKWIIAPDALSVLDMLGFCQRTYAVKR